MESSPTHLAFAPGQQKGTEGADRWEEAAPVASFPANAYGVYDLFGNVWEWVLDPAPGLAGQKLLKGGVWYVCRNRIGATQRNTAKATKRHMGIGFRCAGPM